MLQRNYISLVSAKSSELTYKSARSADYFWLDTSKGLSRSLDRTFQYVRKRSMRELGRGSFSSRYNEGPLRLFTRQRALVLAPSPLPFPPFPRGNPLCRRPPNVRPRAHPFTSLHLEQPPVMVFQSYPTLPLAINAREKVGARLRSRSPRDLRTLCHRLPPKFLLLFFPTNLTLSLSSHSLTFLRAVARIHT